MVLGTVLMHRMLRRRELVTKLKAAASDERPKDHAMRDLRVSAIATAAASQERDAADGIAELRRSVALAEAPRGGDGGGGDAARDDRATAVRRARMCLVDGLLLANDERGAVAACRAGLALDDARAPPGAKFAMLIRLCVVQKAMGDRAGACASARAVAVHALATPDDVGEAVAVLNACGDGAGALAALRTALERWPDAAQLLLLLGVQQSEAGDLDAAIAAFRRTVELEPVSTNAWLNLGTALADRSDERGGVQDRAEELAAFDRVLALAPDSYEGRVGRASVLAADARWEEALGEYRRAVELDPNEIGAYIGIGNCLDGVGELEAAVGAYRKAVSASLAADQQQALLDGARGSAVAHNNLADALRKVGRLDEALAENAKSLAVDGTRANVHAHNIRGDILDNRGDRRGAVAAYEAALALDERSHYAHNNLSDCLLRGGDVARAEAHARRAVEICPTQWHHRCTLSEALSAKGDGAGAVEAAEAALALKETSTAHAVAGAAYRARAREGDAARADGHARRAVELEGTMNFEERERVDLQQTAAAAAAAAAAAPEE